MYHPEKVSKAWAKVSSTAWPPMVTIIASRGSNRRNLGVRSDSAVIKSNAKDGTLRGGFSSYGRKLFNAIHNGFVDSG